MTKSFDTALHSAHAASFLCFRQKNKTSNYLILFNLFFSFTRKEDEIRIVINLIINSIKNFIHHLNHRNQVRFLLHHPIRSLLS